VRDAVATAADLDRECLAIARYLTGQTPNAYVLGKYRDAHARHPRLEARAPADRFLLRIARSSPAGAWLVDCYTALFCRTASIRRKSVLVVALLESSAPAGDYFDAPETASVPRLVSRLAVRGVLFGAGVAGSMVLLAPIHALLRLRSTWSG
jgi:hypothetical protein